ncbi:hypothetical protein KUCAC02_014548 [Chaenocephalus aceratus]|uniref:Uncharacterized protein n=1 Tax=Chaenocephalus aceratus TaxID=36190 RepID=A0ACB9WE92_CHAAC|nr:hypothetical protein KUCAC02_014548 [Chaenocephalus aceratus]
MSFISQSSAFASAERGVELPVCLLQPPVCLRLVPPALRRRRGPAPPPEEARPWGVGIGRLHAEIDYPSNLRTASVSPGRKLLHESPLPQLPPYLCLSTSSLPLPPSPSSLCPCAARGTEGRY